MDSLKLDFNKKHIFGFLFCLVLFGALVRLLAAYNEVHYFDLSYYVRWSKEIVQNGFFSAYSNLASGQNQLDYPPLFLFPLYFVGLLVNNETISNFHPYAMLALKMWQIIFDLATIILIYYVVKKQNKLLALLFASVWAINPTIIFNSSYWGQTDSLMIFMLLLSFFTLEQKRPCLATVFFALACLTKFQCAYFAPVFLIFLLWNFNMKEIAKAIGAGAATAVVIFTPFMLHSGIALPFDIYLGGVGRWPYASLHSFNFFSALGLNYVEDNVKLLPFLSAGGLGTLMTLISVFGVVPLFLTAKKRCPYILSFLVMNSIFMFSSRMHERYQIPVIIFILIAAARHKSLKLFFGFIATSIMVLFNHFFAFEKILSGDNLPPWAQGYDQFLVACSWINVLIYFITLYISLTVLYEKDPLSKLKNRISNSIMRKKEEPVLDTSTEQI